jgi:uncharacterized DUF497 family protein
MEITFDASKRRTALRERGLDFADAAQVFAGRHAVLESAQTGRAEPRFVSAGWLAGRMVVLVWTPTPNGRRIISMRHCHAKEERRWRKALGGP